LPRDGGTPRHTDKIWSKPDPWAPSTSNREGSNINVHSKGWYVVAKPDRGVGVGRNRLSLFGAPWFHDLLKRWAEVVARK